MSKLFCVLVNVIAAICLCVNVCAQIPKYTLDASKQNTQSPVPIPMNSTNPQGETLGVNSRYFTKNAKPWFPVMGEFHFSRYPHQYWEEELLKMKMAGISIVSTYIFWNAHENPRSVWNWEGNRDLKNFISLCKKHGLYVWLRIGPWSHGEQLNGGFPKWIEEMPAKRTNSGVYLTEVNSLFTQISQQTKGLFFKDGGPVVGVQLENEYATGEQGHIAILKKMALAHGIIPAYFTITANTVFNDTAFEALPLQGSYPYRGWEAGGGGPTKDFLYANDQWIMTADLGKLYYNTNQYPKGLCEQGCGSQVTYDNRFVVAPQVVEAHLQNQVGRGMNLIGYYMFHGGTQMPDLKEPGLPESYDFQAPVDEFGLLRTSYKFLKLLHHFINDFGEDLAVMQVVEPAQKVMDERNTDSLRYIGRFNGNHGYVFLNNTQVRVQMNGKKFRLQVQLPGNETITLPRGNFTLPGQTTAVLPINLSAGDVLIKYAIAQPLARFKNNDTNYLFLTALRGTPTEILLDAHTVKTIDAKECVVEKSADNIFIKADSSKASRIDITSVQGKRLVVIIVSRQQAENSWRTTLHGNEYLLLSNADLLVNNNSIELRQLNNPVFRLGMFPKPAAAVFTGMKAAKFTPDNIFTYYTASLQKAGTGVQFSNATKKETEVKLPAKLPLSVSDIFLQINYNGGGAEALINNQVVADNLYNGLPWSIGLKRFIKDTTGSIKITVNPWTDNITGIDKDTVEAIKNRGANLKILALPQYKLVTHL